MPVQKEYWEVVVEKVQQEEKLLEIKRSNKIHDLEVIASDAVTVIGAFLMQAMNSTEPSSMEGLPAYQTLAIRYQTLKELLQECTKI